MVKLHRIPLGFGRFEAFDSVILRASCPVPYRPERVIVASAWFNPDSVRLTGDGREYRLKVRADGRKLGGGSHVWVVEPWFATEFQVSFTPMAVGVAGMIGHVEVEEIPPELDEAIEDEDAEQLISAERA